MSTLPRNIAVATLGFLLLLLLLLLRQAMVAAENTKLDLRLAKNSSLLEVFTMFHEVGDV
jgi:hypothetical protein